MGSISRAYDKLPKWVQLVFMVISLLGIAYGTAHYGFSFLLKVIFSPVP
jgi:hypothetical protein